MKTRLALKIPRLSMNMEEATVRAWLVEPGQSFKKGDPLYSVETEKATSDIEAPSDGVLLEILIPPETDCKVGDLVCRIETDS
jgi:pyruvate/2-oxoglutarate dehydrogenase complex dihydrolipoamide acyltransferase (E2) component